MPPQASFPLLCVHPSVHVCVSCFCWLTACPSVCVSSSFRLNKGLKWGFGFRRYRVGTFLHLCTFFVRMSYVIDGQNMFWWFLYCIYSCEGFRCESSVSRPSRRNILWLSLVKTVWGRTCLETEDCLFYGLCHLRRTPLSLTFYGTFPWETHFWLTVRWITVYDALSCVYLLLGNIIVLSSQEVNSAAFRTLLLLLDYNLMKRVITCLCTRLSVSATCRE